MRSYTIDEISERDMRKVREYLDDHAERSPIEDLYWLVLPEHILTGIHGEHLQCQPYCTAIELGHDFVRFELLLRSRVNHRCRCSRYAEAPQKEFVMAFADEMIKRLDIWT
ncbi:MAG: hypothetical protein ACUVXD_08965 [Thermodesulfobacteriota bacterium]